MQGGTRRAPPPHPPTPERAHRRDCGEMAAGELCVPRGRCLAMRGEECCKMTSLWCSRYIFGRPAWRRTPGCARVLTKQRGGAWSMRCIFGVWTVDARFAVRRRACACARSPRSALSWRAESSCTVRHTRPETRCAGGDIGREMRRRGTAHRRAVQPLDYRLHVQLYGDASCDESVDTRQSCCAQLRITRDALRPA